jgi:uncharacterized repeat protein (TIGR03803 family)
MYNSGTVFKVAPNGTETVLYSFCSQANCADGSYPVGGLILDQSGDLYGATAYGGGVCGGYGCGTLFEISPSGSESLLHLFSGLPNDGSVPETGLYPDGAGNLYGTTEFGGSANASNCADSEGCGTVYELAANGTVSILHSFCVEVNCPDGAEPLASLIMDQSHNLYGTTELGGIATDCAAPGCGVVFKLAPDSSETVLYSFCNQQHCVDGAYPWSSGVIADENGNLYGTTGDGGKTGLNPGGSVFEITRKGKERVLASFGKTADGYFPLGGLISDPSGYLYGTVSEGGKYRYGLVYKRKE